MTDEEVSEDEQPFNFLRRMVRKLDERQPGHAGYITTLPELHGILSELPPSATTVAVIAKPITKGSTDLIAVEIKLGITLSREELGLDKP
jgi:hypothetical protein